MNGNLGDKFKTVRLEENPEPDISTNGNPDIPAWLMVEDTPTPSNSSIQPLSTKTPEEIQELEIQTWLAERHAPDTEPNRRLARQSINRIVELADSQPETGCTIPFDARNAIAWGSAGFVVLALCALINMHRQKSGQSTAHTTPNIPTVTTVTENNSNNIPGFTPQSATSESITPNTLKALSSIYFNEERSEIYTEALAINLREALNRYPSQRINKGEIYNISAEIQQSAEKNKLVNGQIVNTSLIAAISANSTQPIDEMVYMLGYQRFYIADNNTDPEKIIEKYFGGDLPTATKEIKDTILTVTKRYYFLEINRLTEELEYLRSQGISENDNRILNINSLIKQSTDRLKILDPEYTAISKLQSNTLRRHNLNPEKLKFGQVSLKHSREIQRMKAKSLS